MSDDIKKLLKKLIDDPDAAEELTTEQLHDMRQHLNPMGNVVSTKKSYANISIIDMKEKYQQQLLMISNVGFLYRLAHEYAPTDEIEAKFRQDTKDMKHSDAEYQRVLKEHEEYKKQVTSVSRKIITKFLDRNFKYNPDLHLRGSHTENEADPERIKKSTLVDKCATADDSLVNENAAKDNILEAYQLITSTTETLKAALNTLLDNKVDAEDKQMILLKKYKMLNTAQINLKKIAEPIALHGLRYATVETPIDVFHHAKRYFTNHYEQIRELRDAYYHEKIDIEKAVIYYDSFVNEEGAKIYCKQHESEFTTDVFTVSNNGVTLLGPFKENRQRVDFYNKNTEVIKRMMEQCEQDHKLGKDLMEKQVQKQKKKNIVAEGPDAKGLSKYSSAVSTIQELGAKKVLNPEEMKKLEDAQLIKDAEELPEDAIQFDVFYPKEENGELVLNKRRVYTQAETPLHMEDGSPYMDKYQPVNKNYTKKTIVSKDGKKTITLAGDE